MHGRKVVSFCCCDATWRAILLTSTAHARASTWWHACTRPSLLHRHWCEEGARTFVFMWILNVCVLVLPKTLYNLPSLVKLIFNSRRTIDDRLVTDVWTKYCSHRCHLILSETTFQWLLSNFPKHFVCCFSSFNLLMFIVVSKLVFFGGCESDFYHNFIYVLKLWVEWIILSTPAIFCCSNLSFL